MVEELQPRSPLLIYACEHHIQRNGGAKASHNMMSGNPECTVAYIISDFIELQVHPRDI